jgi:predicted metal-dependent peptidase
MHENIEDIISSLILKSSYWAMVISKFDKQKNDTKTFIVGVSFDGDKICFVYNFDNLKHLSIDLIDVLLEHEVGHILNNHYIRAIELQINKQNHLFSLWNTATDMALNCNIKNMPSSFWCGWEFNPCFPKLEGFDDGLLSEDYFNKLIDKNKPEESEHSNDNNSSEEKNEENNENSDNKQTDQNGDGTDDDNKNTNDDNESPTSSEDSMDKSERVSDRNSDSSSSKDDNGNENSEESNNQNGSIDKDKKRDNTPDDNNNNNHLTGIAQNDHEHWKANKKVLSDPNSTYVAENLFQKVINDATKEYTQSFGPVPGNLQVKIDEFLSPPKLPYFALIKKLVVGSRLGKQKISYSKLNRKRMWVFDKEEELGMKFMPPFPGKKNDVSFDIGVLLDTSASVPITDDGIYEALNGLESILKNDPNSEITLLQVDTAIREEKKLKSVKDIHRIEVKGRGGTRLLPGLNRLKELKVDVSIVFTDGYFEDISQYVYSLPKKIIWVLPEKGSTDYQIGKIGHIVKFPVK